MQNLISPELQSVPVPVAESVLLSLYEIICSYGCIRIEINDQGRESVNGVMTKLHEMTGVDQ